jgi:hypothetical protein
MIHRIAVEGNVEAHRRRERMPALMDVKANAVTWVKSFEDAVALLGFDPTPLESTHPLDRIQTAAVIERRISSAGA